MESRDPLRSLQLEVSRLRDENRLLREEVAFLHSAIRALSALQDVIQRLTPDMNLIGLLDDLLASALAVVGAHDGSLLLLDEDTGELAFAVVHGEARERLVGYRLAPGHGIAGWVAQHKTPQIVPDARGDPRFDPSVDETFGFQTRSIACVPLLEGGRVLGVIEAVNKTSDRPFTAVDNDLLLVVAQLAAIAIQRAEKFTGPA